MTVTLYDDGSDLTIPADHVYAAALDLKAWYVNIAGTAGLAGALDAFTRRHPHLADSPVMDDYIVLGAILSTYQWDLVVQPQGIGFLWGDQGTMIEGLESPLTAIATHLDGSWKVSGPDDDRFGGRYQLGVGKVANLEGQIIWSEGEPAEFTTADWHPVVIHNEEG